MAPLFEFKCPNEKCGRVVESIQKASDPAPDCRFCGSTLLRADFAPTSRMSYGIKGDNSASTSPKRSLKE